MLGRQCRETSEANVYKEKKKFTQSGNKELQRKFSCIYIYMLILIR